MESRAGFHPARCRLLGDCSCLTGETMQVWILVLQDEAGRLNICRPFSHVFLTNENSTHLQNGCGALFHETAPGGPNTHKYTSSTTTITRRTLAHKTLTISEEAYAALAKLKNRGESFTDVILRIAGKKRGGTLLEYVRSMEPDEEFAQTLEGIVKNRERLSVRSVEL